MNLHPDIVNQLECIDVRDSPSQCDGGCNFTHKFAMKITKQYRIQDTDTHQVVQTIYCRKPNCGRTRTSTYKVDKPFDWNTNPPVLKVVNDYADFAERVGFWTHNRKGERI